jgi:carbon dioxide concentrating mechanism protein CcmN
MQLISQDRFFVSGDVTIHPSAAIASGVLLQADPSSQIVIAAGVCIGAGTVLHAHQGMLEIETGATLGTGVLVVGSGKIGENACVGSRALIWEQSIDAEQVVPSGSLIGDMGRRVELTSLPTLPFPPPPATNLLIDNPPRGAEVYGKAALNRLMTALFPHQQSLNSLPENRQSSEDDQA